MKHGTCVLALLLLSLGSCNNTDPNEYLAAHGLSGEAMGSYYRITYLGERLDGLEASVDSLLDAYNLELSPWVAESTISRFNASPAGVSLDGTLHFAPNLDLAGEVVDRTGGAYDPTVAPLVNYWGFGTGEHRTTNQVDTAELNAIRENVGFDLVTLSGDSLTKVRPGVQLDLNASAKGYGVDLISKLLIDRGRPNHLVDIGGEMRGGGTKNGRPWRVAIRLPEENVEQVSAAGTLPLAEGRALATSGNYLNYYEVDGETYSHTINPNTGYVERNALLSASVLAPDCATADAYATACMVLGPEGAMRLLEGIDGLDGYLLVRAADGGMEVRVTPGLREQLEEEQ
ncbi:thiamine biosynthesis lipoprotein [Neolewinella xylanilytica]|uniref:FAD:protein FMN transferase n=1 Tax=Neolewinella xylanilytica TaxID=1514080 RepID=A0A2S6IAZ5_9BACT|nr:FAD:protein FMN transferase [Neolewinella xylanilytica]PPK88642.1 thiamine biosynthesis lipoprotein [Neolewinella xylanilytica]